MGRIENAVRNIICGTLGNVVTMLLGFVSRTVMIQILGVTYLGVNGLYTNVLSVLSMADLGIGTAISYSLYKPIAEKDYDKISILMNLYKQVYRIIALIITVIGLLLIPILKYIIKNPGDITLSQLYLYYLVFLFDTVSSYFVSYKFTLSNAEQKNYIQLNIQVITNFIILLSQIIVLVLFKNFLIYLISASSIGLIQKIIVSKYYNRLYPYLRIKNKNQLSNEEKQLFKNNVIALIYHKIGDISINQTDNIIISTFINITMVGILSNYNMIIITVMGFLNIIFNTVISGLGNAIVTESKDKQYLLFKAYRFLGFWIYGVSILMLIFLLTPFITIWLGSGMTIEKSIILLIMIDYYFKGHRTVINNFKTAAGIFQADKYISIIQAVTNLLVSIVLVQFIGLAGVFIGTIVSGLIANFTKPYIIYKMVFNKKVYNYYKESVFYMIIIGFVYMILNLLSKVFLYKITIFRFVFMLFILFTFTNIIFYICFRQKDEFKYLLTIILAKYEEKKNLLFNHKKVEYSDIVNPINNQNNQSQSQNGELSFMFHELENNTRMQMSSYSIKTTKPPIKSIISSMINPDKIEKNDQPLELDGLMATALEWSYIVNKDMLDINCIQEYYDKWIKNNAVIDNPNQINNGYSLIYLHQLTMEDRYKQSIEQIKMYIDSSPRDKAGNLLFRKNDGDDIYIDSIGKICPFLCRYGTVYNDQSAIDLSIWQLMNYIRYGFDSKTFLPYHGYNVGGNLKNGIIGWGIGVGWLLIGIVDSIQYIAPSNPYYHSLKYQFNLIVKTIVNYQMKNGYYTWQLTALEGQVDSSTTAMISYAIKRGVMTGILNRSFLYYAQIGLSAIGHSIEQGLVKDAYAGSKEFGIYPQKSSSSVYAQGSATALSALSLNDDTVHHHHKKNRHLHI